jgi:hypothetical protein
MNTLREIGEFIGTSPETSMHAVGDILPMLSSSARTSMRATILGLQNLNLPPFTLQAVTDCQGLIPILIAFAAGGIVWQV